MIFISVSILIAANISSSAIFNSTTISYTQFEKMVENNEIKTIKYRKSDNTMYAIDTKGNAFKTENPDYNEFKKEYLQKGINFEPIGMPTLQTCVELVFRVVFLSILLTILIGSLGGADKIVGSKNKQLEDGKIPKVKFDDISGLDDVKNDLKLAVEYLKNPQDFTEIGAKMPTGMVFYGSPGTGKIKVVLTL